MPRLYARGGVSSDHVHAGPISDDGAARTAASTRSLGLDRQPRRVAPTLFVLASNANLAHVKGGNHRGGMRVSMNDAVPLESRSLRRWWLGRRLSTTTATTTRGAPPGENPHVAQRTPGLACGLPFVVDACPAHHPHCPAELIIVRQVQKIAMIAERPIGLFGPGCLVVPRLPKVEISHRGHIVLVGSQLPNRLPSKDYFIRRCKSLKIGWRQQRGSRKDYPAVGRLGGRSRRWRGRPWCGSGRARCCRPWGARCSR